MNRLKRLLHLEEPEPVEKPEPEPPVVEPCPICGLVPKLKHVCVTRNYRDYWLEKDSWQLLEWCDHVESILSFASFFEDESVQKWNTGCSIIKTRGTTLFRVLHGFSCIIGPTFMVISY